MGRLNRIKELREERNWTQAQLAKLLDVQPSTVFRWENGEREPSPEEMYKLRRLFGLTMYAELFVNPHSASELA